MSDQRYLIAPSILSADFLHLGKAIAESEQAGADWIHVDVMDGHFVPNLTMGPFVVEHVRRATELPIDVHLMVDQPENMIQAFADSGASHLTVHVETCPEILRVLERIQALGCKAGVTANPSTPASSLDTALPHVDLVLVMSVKPGYSGQEFMPEVLSKVTYVRNRLDELNSNADLVVDEGINASTITKVCRAGGNVFVAASAIFSHPAGIEAGIHALQNAIRGDHR